MEVSLLAKSWHSECVPKDLSARRASTVFQPKNGEWKQQLSAARQVKSSILFDIIHEKNIASIFNWNQQWNATIYKDL